jgi:hypothetical protein
VASADCGSWDKYLICAIPTSPSISTDSFLLNNSKKELVSASKLRRWCHGVCADEYISLRPNAESNLINIFFEVKNSLRIIISLRFSEDDGINAPKFIFGVDDEVDFIINFESDSN